MKQVLALLPILALAAACGTSGGGAAKTVTVTAPAPAGTSATPAAAATSSSVAAGALPDACGLLTQAEAQKVAGTKLMKPVGAGQQSGGNYIQCQFTGPTSGPTAQVEVYVGDGAKQQLHIERDNLKHKFMTVPGIGDLCLQEEGFIFVEKHGLFASIRLVRLNDPKQDVKPLQTGIEQLAARLP